MLDIPTLNVTICTCSGFIRGREGESPSLITFKTNYNEGALLATVSGHESIDCKIAAAL